MNHKVKSTVAGVLVALGFVSTSGLLGQAPIAVEANRNTIAYNEEISVTNTAAETSNSHDQRLRRQLSMPYFSFGRVLPKQGL
jgi:hypothetical protein